MSLWLSGCAVGSSCDVGELGANGKPCWLSTTPKEGVVVNIAEHIRPEKTEEMLLDLAIAQLAKLKGASVRSATQVSREINQRNDVVERRASTSTLSEVKVDSAAQMIETEIVDRYIDPYTRKHYMWVKSLN